MSQLPPNHWNSLLAELESRVCTSTIPRTVQIDWLERLNRQHAEPWRHYHNADHTTYLIAQFEARGRAVAQNPLAVLTAIWFQDAKMVPGARNNELWSAVLASQFCEETGLTKVFTEYVVTLVMATAPSGVEHETPDEDLIADIDLTALGGTWEQFCNMGVQIRQEYVGGGFVTAQAYDKERPAFLEKMLRWHRIYKTPVFHDAYETQARANIRRFLYTDV